jgi:hypothetical protein
VPDWLEIVLAAAAVLLVVAVLMAFVFCVSMWVAASTLARRKRRAVATAVLAPDALPDFWTTETADEQWARDELNLTFELRSAEIDALDNAYDGPAFIRPPVTRGRE